MKVLITGGFGFIGQKLAAHLREKKMDVWTFDTSYGHDNPRHLRGSVLNFKDLRAAVRKKDLVFHTAGLVGTTELLSRNIEAIDVNIKGTVNVLRACREEGVGRVFVPTKPNVWRNTYSITKRAAEEFAKMYSSLYGMDVRILRWLNIYGPGQALYPIRKVVPMMIMLGLNDLDIEIYGDGEQLVYLEFVEDVVGLTVAYMLHDSTGSTPRETGLAFQLKVKELAEVIRKMTGSAAGIRHEPMRPGEASGTEVPLVSSEKAADLIAFEGELTPLRAGLERTINHYKSLPARKVRDALDFYQRRRRIEWRA